MLRKLDLSSFESGEVPTDVQRLVRLLPFLRFSNNQYIKNLNCTCIANCRFVNSTLLGSGLVHGRAS